MYCIVFSYVAHFTVGRANADTQKWKLINKICHSSLVAVTATVVHTKTQIYLEEIPFITSLACFIMSVNQFNDSIF